MKSLQLHLNFPKFTLTSIIEKEALKIQSLLNLTWWLGMSRQV